MAYRLISLLMLAVLLWTGTLLHDIAEDAPALSQLAKQSTLQVVDAPQQSCGEIVAPEHTHMAVSNIRTGEDVSPTNAPQQVVPPGALSFKLQMFLLSCNYGRPPPHAPPPQTAAKLYLVNRHLLI